MQLGKPVRAHRLLIRVDLGHVLAQAGLMPGHPHLGAGAALLVATAAAGWPTGPMPVPIKAGDPGVVVNALRHGHHPHPVASDHGQRFAWPAG